MGLRSRHRAPGRGLWLFRCPREGINSQLLIAWLVLALAISCARFLRFALDEPDWLAAQVSIKGVAHSTHAHSADANVATASRLQSVMRVMRGTLLA